MTSTIQVREIRQSMPPLRNWDKPFAMFYDETNNIRRLTLSEVGLNAPENRSFVLAGIALQPGQRIENIDALRATLQIQANAAEIKFRHVAQGDYEAVLSSHRLNSFLNWLVDQGILIHYSTLNVLYWSLIDIIDSLMPDDAFGIGRYHLHLKSELYDVVTRSPAEFMLMLHSFGYPNIGRDSVRTFLGAVSDFINRHSPENRNDGSLLLKQTLRQAIQLDELVFLHDNKPGELIKDFSMFFLRSLYVFRNALHTFDRETNIERILKSVDVRDGQRRVDYQFVDSKDNVCVQLSDVVAGLIGKHYSYVQSHSIATLKARKAGFSVLQKQNLSLLRELINRTDAVSDGFCHSIIPLDGNFKNNVFLHGHNAPSNIS